MIRVEKLSKTFDGNRSWAVKDVSFEVREGQLLILLGRSGCGKTTTLKMINRLVEPSAGRVLIDDEDVTASDPIQLRRRIGYVFQNFGLFPHMTVAENLGIVPRLLGWERERIAKRCDELLAMVGLVPERYRARYPSELSGGERQRVGFARALAAKPAIMLLDEPFGAVDLITRAELRKEFYRIQKELRLTAVMVTHDVSVALLLADVLVIMREGEVVQAGQPQELLEHPVDPFVKTLLEMPRALEGRENG